MPSVKADVILLAAGSGARMEGIVEDKILAPLDGVPVFLRSWRAFAAIDGVERIAVVFRDEAQAEALRALLADEPRGEMAVFIRGGKERADSVRRGLTAPGLVAPLVAVHDGARPLIRPEVIAEAMAVAARDGASVVAHPVVDTIKRVPGNGALERALLEDLDRSALWAMETPQVFRRDWLTAGYAQAEGRLTDDTATVVALGHGVTVVSNPSPNPKITRPEDLAWAEFLLEAGRS